MKTATPTREPFADTAASGGASFGLAPPTLLLAALAMTWIVAPLGAQEGPVHESSVYGKLNMTVQMQDESETDTGGNTTDSSKWVLSSNASRIGVKGSIKSDADAPVKVLYQLEYEVAADDGDPVLKQRNSYVGVQGDFGKIVAGNYDTPLKKGQLQVDVFNDSNFDIKSLLPGDERRANLVQYESPKLVGGALKFTVASLLTEEDDKGLFEETSLSAAWVKDSLSIGVATDTRTDEDRLRLAVQWQASGLQVGALFQTVDLAAGESPDAATVVSFKYSWGKNGVYGQLVNSGQQKPDGSFTGFGYEYKFTKNAKWYGFYGSMETGDSDSASTEETAFAAGLEVKF